LGIGSWVLAAHSTAVQYLHVANLDYGLVQAAAVTIILVGCVVFIIGVLGCCGAVNENPHCLTAFSAILIVLLVLQVIAIILAGSLHSQIIHTLASEMNQSMINEYDQQGHWLETEAWNFLQMEMKCCGVGNDGPLEWKGTYWYKNNATDDAVVPQSCCADLKEPKYNFTAVNATACYLAASGTGWDEKERSKYVNVQGCETSLNKWFMDSIAVLIGGIVAVIIVQVIIVVMSCVLKSNIQNSYEHV